MENVNVIRNFSSTSNEGKLIVNALEELGCASASNNEQYRSVGLFNDKFSMDKKEYKEKNEDAKMAILGFAAKASGMSDIVDYGTKDGLARCFSNTNFKEIYNSIIVEAIGGIIVNSNPTALMALCNIENVEIGGSVTIEIDTKGLPIAQRTSYGSNVSLLDGFTKQGITITPKPWTVGSQIDYIRILDKVFDFGKEIARVSMALLYAQYRLIVAILFNSTPLNGTPFYSATYSGDKVVNMVSNLEAVNGGSPVKAYGTLPCFNSAGTISTTNFGFETQDEMIRNGFIGRANGIENIVLTQATGLDIPFTTANLDKSLLIPNDKMLLLSGVGSKPVTLVREKFVFAKEVSGTESSTHRLSYAYTQSFDAGLATQAHYGIIEAKK